MDEPQKQDIDPLSDVFSNSMFVFQTRKGLKDGD